MPRMSRVLPACPGSRHRQGIIKSAQISKAPDGRRSTWRAGSGRWAPRPTTLPDHAPPAVAQRSCRHVSGEAPAGDARGCRDGYQDVEASSGQLTQIRAAADRPAPEVRRQVARPGRKPIQAWTKEAGDRRPKAKAIPVTSSASSFIPVACYRRGGQPDPGRSCPPPSRRRRTGRAPPRHGPRPTSASPGLPTLRNELRASRLRPRSRVLRPPPDEVAGDRGPGPRPPRWTATSRRARGLGALPGTAAGGWSGDPHSRCPSDRPQSWRSAAGPEGMPACPQPTRANLALAG